jgi:hypothetical protein
VDYPYTMNQTLLAAITVIAVLAIAALATPTVALAQNETGGTPEKSKLPAEQNMTGNKTITEGVLPPPNMTTPSG